MDAHKRRASTDCNESRNSKRKKADLHKKIEQFSVSETLPKYLQNGIVEEVGESKNYHLRPKTNNAITMAFNRDYEEYSNILKNSIDNIELAQENCKVLQNKLMKYKKSFSILSNELRRKCPFPKYAFSDKEFSVSETLPEYLQNGIGEEVEESKNYHLQPKTNTEFSVSETLPEYLQNGIGEEVGESKNYHLRPKTNTKLSYRLILTKQIFDTLFTSYQELPGITEHQKQVMVNELFALEIEYEKYANIIKQNIDDSCTFCLNHLNDATQMRLRVKYQLWKDTMDSWFADMRKKRECLSVDMNYKTEKSGENPPQKECLSIDLNHNYKTKKSEESPPQRAKVSLQSDMNLRGDILKSDGLSGPPSELCFDDNIRPEPESWCSTLSCQICQEVLNSKQALQTHISTKHRAKLCTLCGFIAGKVSNLEKHVNQSHKFYKVCTVCEEICYSHNLCPHLAKQKNYQTINKDCKRIHQCCVCPKSFQSQELLNTHKIKHKTLHYQCDFCDKLSESLYEQNKHKSEHLTKRSKKLLCRLCYNNFETNGRLTAHIKKRHHMPINKYPNKMLCIICDFEYDDPNQLIIHLKNDHETDSMVIRSGEDKKKGPSSHQCRFCDIYCANLKIREVHVITAHGTAPYECVVCQATFLTKSQFDVHTLKHTKEEEFRAGLKLPKGK